MTSLIKIKSRALTAKEFQGLSEVPAELEWFANISSDKTRKTYHNDLRYFMGFVGIEKPKEFRLVTRADVIAWRDD